MEENKDRMIKTLKDSIKLKDEQITTLKESLDLKNEQLDTLESSLDLKNEKVETLEESIKVKEEQIKEIKKSSVNKELLEDKNKIIEELEEKVKILNEELEKSDQDFEKLEAEIEKIRESTAQSSVTGIIDYTKVEITKDQIIEKMRDILGKALHNVMIAVPSIIDLQDLYLYEIRSSVNMKISCLINPGIELHSELLEELESLDNISIRLYEGEDRFVILRDGEELLFSVIGSDENNFLTFQTRDPHHIKLFQSAVMETWLRSKKI
ncbi:MAG: hypothetical protein ACQERB_00870 [Promethearchaeati archaeon]